MTDDLEKARQRRERSGRGSPTAGALARTPGSSAIDRVLAKVDAAAERRDPAAYYAGKTPRPSG